MSLALWCRPPASTLIIQQKQQERPSNEPAFWGRSRTTWEMLGIPLVNTVVR